MAVSPHSFSLYTDHSVPSTALLNVCRVYETMCVLGICEKHLDASSQHSFLLREERECSNFRLQSMAWFDIDQRARQPKEQWQQKKCSNCESKPKQTGWYFTGMTVHSSTAFNGPCCLTYFPYCCWSLKYPIFTLINTPRGNKSSVIHAEMCSLCVVYCDPHHLPAL